MTPERIKSLRHALGENTATFGQRFHRSGRSVENWEQGRRRPDGLAIEAMKKLEKEVERMVKK